MRQTEALASLQINKQTTKFYITWSSLSFGENTKQAVPRIKCEKYLRAKGWLKLTLSGSE